MKLKTPLSIQNHLNWIKSAGINDKKYNPWIGAQLLGVRDQFLLFHPLVLLWDLKRIQLFLMKVQSFTNYSFLLIESREEIRRGLHSYLSANNIPKELCHVLHFDFPGTLTNQYYMNTQSTSSSVITSRQILVFFDYYLNRQFYTESLNIPCIRLSLYSLQNLPTNMQYGLPAKSGLLLAIRLILKLLLKPSGVAEVKIYTDKYNRFIKNFNICLPKYGTQPTLLEKSAKRLQVRSNAFRFKSSPTRLKFWEETSQLLIFQKKWKKLKNRLSMKLQKIKNKKKSQFTKFISKRSQINSFGMITYKCASSLRFQALYYMFKKSRKSFSTKKLTGLLLFKYSSLHWKDRASFKRLLCRGVKNIKTGKKIILSPNTIISYYDATAKFKHKNKPLLEKYNRTCNIKTQKEWQIIKERNKAKNEAVRRKQREHSLNSRTAASFGKKRGATKPNYDKLNRAWFKKTGSNFRETKNSQPLTRAISRPVVQTGVRTYTTKRQKKIKHSRANSKKYRRYSIVKYRYNFFGGKTWLNKYYSKEAFEELWQNSFRLCYPSKRFRLQYNYWTFPRNYITPSFKKISGWSKIRQLSTHIKEVRSVPSHILSYSSKRETRSVLSGISSLKKIYLKSKQKHRIVRFIEWRRTFKRIIRKRDKRWRSALKKKDIINQLNKSFQRSYISPNLARGTFFWTKLQMPRFKKPLSWRKWRSKHFRRYARREQFQLALMYKPVTDFVINKTFWRLKSKVVAGYNKCQISMRPSRIIVPLSSLTSEGAKNSLSTKKAKTGSVLRRLTRKLFLTRRKYLKRVVSKHKKRVNKKEKMKKKLTFFGLPLSPLQNHLMKDKVNCFGHTLLNRKRNFTAQLWFRFYRSNKLDSAFESKRVYQTFRQLSRQKQTYAKRQRLQSSYWSDVKLSKLVRFKRQKLWNWRKFKDRHRSSEEIKRYAENFKHTRIKLSKHRNLTLVVSKKLRLNTVQKILKGYSRSIFKSDDTVKNGILLGFKNKPIRLSKFNFLRFGGRLVQNKNILIGFNSVENMRRSTFIQVYKNRRFWADDNFGPSPLIFWISPKSRRLETPKQWKLNSSIMNYHLNIQLPVFSCTNYLNQGNSNLNNLVRSTPFKYRTVPSQVSYTLVKELTNVNSYQKTLKFFVESARGSTKKKQRWLWYYLQNKYRHPSIHWQKALINSKKLTYFMKKTLSNKVFLNHNVIPKSVDNHLQYLLRCSRRRRRRLRERTFKGPTRYRRKYKTQYMFNYLTRLNSHRPKYRKPDLKNRVNHYFIRKVVLRRFLRFIYGPKLTNHYFKHFSNLLFIKKFKFWTLYTFFYLRLDFITILLKFAATLTGARYLIGQEAVLVNNKPTKASYSIFLGDVIQYKPNFNTTNSLLSTELDFVRNVHVHSPRVLTSFRYQTRSRVPQFFEYNGRIRAGTMFRLPWYYEVRGKLINKENFLLLARGPHSI